MLSQCCAASSEQLRQERPLEGTELTCDGKQGAEEKKVKDIPFKSGKLGVSLQWFT